MPKPKDENFVSFGDVARKRLGEQCQYARHFLAEAEFNEGIRWQGRIEDYHGLTIHKDDVETSRRSLLEFRPGVEPKGSSDEDLPEALLPRRNVEGGSLGYGC